MSDPHALYPPCFFLTTNHCRLKREEEKNFDTDELNNDQFFFKYATQLYWGWTGGIGGLVVYLLATAHSVMWTRTSCILGSVVSKIKILYCQCMYMSIDIIIIKSTMLCYTLISAFAS